jgi:CHAT domain-containing protein
MTLYSELKQRRREHGASSLVAFGDPRYPRTDGDVVALEVGDAAVRSALTRSLGLQPLPSTLIEVQSITRLWGEGAAARLAEKATEDRVKDLGAEPDLIHFACHGIVDQRFPLDSALALTIPARPEEGQDNGLLQAWEIFEQVRIDADLVTLSACESGLGKEVAGEGLIGLTRAFQYAGARTVLAALWSVADVSTAELMRRFYTHFKAGDSKDVALQRAQVEFIAGPIEVRSEGATRLEDYSDPYHWAAFQVIGDWR